MTAQDSGQVSREPGPAPVSPAADLPALPPTWPGRAARLEQLMGELAALRAEETQQYATGFFAAGCTTDTQRTQRGKQHAAGHHLAAEQKSAQLAGYQLMLEHADEPTPGEFCGCSCANCSGCTGT
jgi:hypothetical protein